MRSATREIGVLRNPAKTSIGAFVLTQHHRVLLVQRVTRHTLPSCSSRQRTTSSNLTSRDTGTVRLARGHVQIRSHSGFEYTRVSVSSCSTTVHSHLRKSLSTSIISQS